MGFSRGLANIVTLGATGRVDKANDEYQSTVARYNRYVDEIQSKSKKIKKLQSELEQHKSFMNRNKSVIRRIISDKGLINQLTSEEKDAIEIYKTMDTSLSEIKDFSCSAIKFTSGWTDYTADNVSTIIATAVVNIIPFAGVAAAHSSASDEIEKIQRATADVVSEIEKIEPTYTQIYKAEEKMQLQNKVYGNLKNIFSKFGVR